LLQWISRSTIVVAEAHGASVGRRASFVTGGEYISNPTFNSMYEIGGKSVRNGWTIKVCMSVTLNHTYIAVKSVNRLQVSRREFRSSLKIIWTTMIELTRSCAMMRTGLNVHLCGASLWDVKLSFYWTVFVGLFLLGFLSVRNNNFLS